MIPYWTPASAVDARGSCPRWRCVGADNVFGRMDGGMWHMACEGVVFASGVGYLPTGFKLMAILAIRDQEVLCRPSV